MSMRILVTGSNGFVGRHLCIRLESLGHEVLRSDLGAGDGGEVYFDCDIADSSAVDSLVEWAGHLDVVVHLAAVTFVPDSQTDPARVMDVNLRGTIHLIDAVKRYVSGTRFLYVSSAEVYGPPATLPVDEEHQLNPQNPYAISKAAADQYCAYAQRSGDLDIVRMRPFNHSGPGQSDSFVLSSFGRQISEMEIGQAEPVLRVGNLDSERDFLHVDDVVEAYVRALDAGESGAVYNICSGVARSIQSALDGLLELAEVKVEIQVDANRVRGTEVACVYGSAERFTRLTGWQPEKSFEALLEDTLEYWRGQLPPRHTSK